MLLRWVFTCKLFLPIRECVGLLLRYCRSVNNQRLVTFCDPDSKEAFKVISKIQKDNTMAQGEMAAYCIYMAVKKINKLQGDIAEVGVYKGGTAKLICEARKEVTVHLFDTFNGLPELSINDDSVMFHKGEWSAEFEKTKNYLSQYTNVQFHKGIFPSTADCVKDSTFCFLHLDVDIYESTLECLKFFYPRMNRGGIIISHDYICSKGVNKAFDEFFQDKPEIIFELPNGEQCLVIKL